MSASLQRQIGDPGREAVALDCTGEAMAAAGNTADAAAFHLQAARMQRQLGDGWQEALATVHLAGCEAALGNQDAEREHLAHAAQLIERFHDDRAASLRADLLRRLA